MFAGMAGLHGIGGIGLVLEGQGSILKSQIAIPVLAGSMAAVLGEVSTRMADDTPAIVEIGWRSHGDAGGRRVVHEFHGFDGVCLCRILNSVPRHAGTRSASAPTIAAVAVGAWVNYRIDLYGVFGRNDGAARVAYTNERANKYLLSMRYVPERFDALLVGTSVTDNWDTAKIGAFRVYNGSLSGGNISEGKLIVDNALATKTPRAILFCVYPYLTETHGRKRSGMDTREFLGALGSLQLLRDYSTVLLISHGFSRPLWNEYGVFDPTATTIESQLAPARAGGKAAGYTRRPVE